MKTRLLVSISALALIAGTGLASAQDKGSPANPPPAKQSAPSESSDAPGHDAQSGRPEMGERPTQPRAAGERKDAPETQGSTGTTRPDGDRTRR
jgi:hypothetical protein